MKYEGKGREKGFKLTHLQKITNLKKPSLIRVKYQYGFCEGSYTQHVFLAMTEKTKSMGGNKQFSAAILTVFLKNLTAYATIYLNAKLN